MSERDNGKKALDYDWLKACIKAQADRIRELEQENRNLKARLG